MNTQLTGQSIFQGKQENTHFYAFQYSSRELPHIRAIPASESRSLLSRNYELLAGASPVIQTYTLPDASMNDDKYLVVVHYEACLYAFFIRDEYGYQSFMATYSGTYSVLPELMNPFWKGNNDILLTFPC
jgi:hypothetical protein